MSSVKTGPAASLVRRNWRIIGLLLIISWLIIGCSGSADEVQARYVIQDRITFLITIAGVSG